MDRMIGLGQVVVLNGAPRSGKSSIAGAIQNEFKGIWINLGVDAYTQCMTPPAYRPGIGLRPGGERPDLETAVAVMFAALYESIAAHSRLGLNVVVDVGHHDQKILTDCARRLEGIPALLVGVRCPIETVLARRAASPEGSYLIATPEDPLPEPIARWQRAVHLPGIYDLEIDTSVLTPGQCAAIIRERLSIDPGGSTAFQKIAARSKTGTAQ